MVEKAQIQEAIEQCCGVVEAQVRATFTTLFAQNKAVFSNQVEGAGFKLTVRVPKNNGAIHKLTNWAGRKKLESSIDSTTDANFTFVTVIVDQRSPERLRKELLATTGLPQKAVEDGAPKDAPTNKPVVVKVTKPDLSDKFLEALEYIEGQQALLFQDPGEFFLGYLDILVGASRAGFELEFRTKGYRIYLRYGYFDQSVLRTALEQQHDCGFDQLGYFHSGEGQPDNVLWFAPKKPVAQFQDQQLLADLRVLVEKYKFVPEPSLQQMAYEALTGPLGGKSATMLVELLKASGYFPKERSLLDRVREGLADQGMIDAIVTLLREAGKLPEPSLEDLVANALAGAGAVLIATMFFEKLAEKDMFPKEQFAQYVLNEILLEDADDFLIAILSQLKQQNRLARLLLQLGLIAKQKVLLAQESGGFSAQMEVAILLD